MRDFDAPAALEDAAKVYDPEAWRSCDTEAGAFELRYRRWDARILAAVAKNEGGRIGNIRDRLGKTGADTVWINRRLRALEKAGKVARNLYYTVPNSIYWMLA